MEFTKLESAVLALIVDEYGWEFPGLAEHIAATRPVARENTGGGFFVDLVVDKNAVTPSRVDNHLDGVVVRLDGTGGKLETALHFKDGRAYLLEGYSVEGESTSQVDFDAGRFSEVGLLWPSRKPTT